jgi:membrane-bound metal-dependent hydrolase YbcI (DUF457 family)
MLNHFIGCLGKPQRRSLMSLLPSAFLLALVAQAFWLPYKAIGGRGQAAIAAVFRQLILDVFRLLGQTRNLCLHLLYQQALLQEQAVLLLNSGITLCQLFTQVLIVFFCRHAFTLLASTSLGKSQANLGSYKFAMASYTLQDYIVQGLVSGGIVEELSNKGMFPYEIHSRIRQLESSPSEMP